MSNETWVINSDLSFSDIDKALSAIKSFNYDYEYEGINSVPDIFKAFEAWSLLLNERNSGNYTIKSIGDCLGDEKELFHAIAPFVKKGSFVKLGVEEGEVLTYSFDGKKCKEKSSISRIGGVYDLVFTYTNEANLKDHLNNFGSQFTFNINANGNSAKVIFNEQVCANITISCQGQKLFKSFLHEQGEIIEAKVADGDTDRIENLLKELNCIALVKFSESKPNRDLSIQSLIGMTSNNMASINEQKKNNGTYWKDYLGLCEENGIYCIPGDGYFDLNSEDPILNLDY